MRKNLPLIVALMIVLSGCIAVAVPQNTTRQVAAAIDFSTPKLQSINGYLTVTLPEMTADLMVEGKPIVPKIVKVYDLPFGSSDISVQVTPGTLHQQVLTTDIHPGYKALPLLDGAEVGYVLAEDAATYASTQPYPGVWYDYQATGGLDDNMHHVTHVSVAYYPVRYIPATKTLQTVDSMQVTISYQPPNNPKTFGNTTDLVIITPRKFNSAVQPLVDHKNAHGIKTIVMNTETIYKTYTNGTDKAEKVKFYIKDAIEQSGVKFVMLLGGLNNKLYAIDRENPNTGSKSWLVPVRYTNVWEDQPPNIFDPGYLSDLYYSDIYTGTGQFSSWDPNHDGIYSAWGYPHANKDNLDLDPDVYVGRLACITAHDVKTVVNKIIAYETTSSGDWLKKMITVSGDGFQDQNDLAINWNVNGLPTGQYTIYAQSRNMTGTLGPISATNVTVDLSQPSNITFSENDYLMGLNFPAPPRGIITSPSEGNILGNTPVNFIPPQAYIGEQWAIVKYASGIMTMRGKSYDPRPGGNFTIIHVWVKNGADATVFDTETPSEVWFEGERENAKGQSYMPADYTIQELWSSNGAWTSESDVITAMSAGAKFVYFAGHGNPAVWANHYPGIPGGRSHASITGLANEHLKAPFFPMSEIKNGGKLPVVIVGGCHNSMFNITLFRSILQGGKYWTYGMPIWDAWSWTLIRLAKGGSIATIGSSGLGYGYLGFASTEGLGGWIDSHFFQVYREKLDAAAPPYLGQIHSQAISDYVHLFPPNSELTDYKTVQEWVLLGDPSLVIGGYQ